MAHEPLLVGLRGTVAAGERLHEELRDDLRRTEGEGRNAVRLELAMF